MNFENSQFKISKLILVDNNNKNKKYRFVWFLYLNLNFLKKREKYGEVCFSMKFFLLQLRMITRMLSYKIVKVQEMM